MLLRDRSGDFVRDLISEAAGFDGEPGLLDAQRLRALQPRCLRRRIVQRDGRELAAARHALVDRSSTGASFTRGLRRRRHRRADRWLPGCAPRWLKLDRKALAQTGGVAIYLEASPRLDRRRPGRRHPGELIGVTTCGQASDATIDPTASLSRCCQTATRFPTDR